MTCPDDASSPKPVLGIIARRLKQERERVGLSASALARRAGIAKSTLTQIEAANGNPSVETLWALATALGVPFARLIAAPRSNIRVLRAGEGVATYAEHTDFTATLMANCPAGSQHNIYRIDLAAAATRHSEPHMAGTVEHLIVTAGRMHAGPSDARFVLAAGDYMTFPGDVAHVYKAIDGAASALLIMEYG